MESNETIPVEECWDLLTSASVGRIALSVRALPAILPVQYYVDRDWLAICLGHHRVPPQTVNDTVVAFAADAIDAEQRTGWTVQVQGVARLFDTIGVQTDCGQPAAGQVVRLEPATITGHHIELCPFAAGVLNFG
jgi:hypothetical protein